MPGYSPDRWRVTRRTLLAGVGGMLPLAFAGSAWPDSGLFDQAKGAVIGRAVRVLSGDAFELADGRELRLAGIEAPRPPRRADSGGSGGATPARRWPLAEAATRALTGLVKDSTLFSLGTVLQDRHGHKLAHVRREDGVWLQGSLLEAGHARVRTRPDQTDLVADMLKLENQARQAKLGIWASRAYAPRPAVPAALAQDIGSFQLIEGRVLAVGLVDGGAYLNFGPDWRRDVTVHIGRGVMRRFLKAGMDPKLLEGRRLRVRGWIEERNGPLLAATHPEQIERLGDP